MTRIIGDDALISILGTYVLRRECQDMYKRKDQQAYILLLLINVSDLKPNVGVGEGTWGVAKNAIEAGEGLIVLPLLFIDDAESKEDLVGFIEI
jgi:hypothetical protein